MTGGDSRRVPSVRYPGSHLFPGLRQTSQLVSKKISTSLLYLWISLRAGLLVSLMSLKAHQYLWTAPVLLWGMWENWLISDSSSVLQDNEVCSLDSHPLLFMYCRFGMLVFNGQNLFPQNPARKQVKSPQPLNQQMFLPFFSCISYTMFRDNSNHDNISETPNHEFLTSCFLFCSSCHPPLQ